jgi:hypothetical protein
VIEVRLLVETSRAYIRGFCTSSASVINCLSADRLAVEYISRTLLMRVYYLVDWWILRRSAKNVKLKANCLRCSSCD